MKCYVFVQNNSWLEWSFYYQTRVQTNRRGETITALYLLRNPQKRLIKKYCTGAIIFISTFVFPNCETKWQCLREHFKWTLYHKQKIKTFEGSYSKWILNNVSILQSYIVTFEVTLYRTCRRRSNGRRSNNYMKKACDCGNQVLFRGLSTSFENSPFRSLRSNRLPNFNGFYKSVNVDKLLNVWGDALSKIEK